MACCLPQKHTRAHTHIHTQHTQHTYTHNTHTHTRTCTQARSTHGRVCASIHIQANKSLEQYTMHACTQACVHSTHIRSHIRTCKVQVHNAHWMRHGSTCTCLYTQLTRVRCLFDPTGKRVMPTKFLKPDACALWSVGLVATINMTDLTIKLQPSRGFNKTIHPHCHMHSLRPFASQGAVF